MVIVQKAINNMVFKEKFKKVLDNLDIKYKDISNYILAFIHRSVVNERPDFAPENNERLEFLWDAVLELIITKNLFKDYKQKTEWELTDIRSAIVRWTNLAKVAKKLNFSDNLILWKWEEKWWWRNNDYLLANTVESFLWAIYLDLWIEEVTIFINKYIYSTIDEILKFNLIKDFKTSIQEYIQLNYEITPHYKVLSQKWLDHLKIFEVWIYIWQKIIWKWKWSSKKKAEEQAAKNWFLKITK